jgi:hypothetical protein
MTEGQPPRWGPPDTGRPAEQDTQRLPPSYGGSPWGSPPYPAGQPRTEGLAVAALVLAVLSFFVPVLPALVPSCSPRWPREGFERLPQEAWVAADSSRRRASSP